MMDDEIKIVIEDEQEFIEFDFKDDVTRYTYDDTEVKSLIDKNTTDISNIKEELVSDKQAIEENSASITDNQQAIQNNVAEITTVKQELAEEKEKTQTNTTDITNIKEELAEELRVHYIYRGEYKGDCMLVQAKDKNVLIDFGNEADCAKLIEYLVNNNLTKIDYVIISHYHGDHIGAANAKGLVEFVNNTQLDLSNCVFYLPAEIDYEKTYKNGVIDNTAFNFVKNLKNIILNQLTQKGIEYVIPKNEELLILGDNAKIRFLNCNTDEFEIYYEVQETSGENVITKYNNFSLVAELTHYDNTFLFTGDIEQEAQKNVAPYLKKCADVYKVEHHGLEKMTDGEFIKKMKPKIAVLMEYTENVFFTQSETLKLLMEMGTEFYSMNESQNVVVTSKKGELFAESNEGIVRGVIKEKNISPTYITVGTGTKEGEWYAKLATIEINNTYINYSGTIVINSAENKGLNGIVAFRVSTDLNIEPYTTELKWLSLNDLKYKDCLVITNEGNRFTIYLKIIEQHRRYSYTFLNCSSNGLDYTSIEFFSKSTLIQELPEPIIATSSMYQMVAVNTPTNFTGQVLMGNILIQYGTVEITPTDANVPMKYDLVFPYKYKLAPNVQVTPISGTVGVTVLGVATLNTTVSGTEIYVTSTTTSTRWVSWFAIGEADDTVTSL